ncbi:hypothetical protein [Anthocerotibacter panamensis]|uniref:hypothetical protein n=1 Tax=Anthocerotibacter panamensis TaxID=2857077 RepID=UPI001C403936|nr:hypothetical protein [Anthocerotibacter panamensis]
MAKDQTKRLKPDILQTDRQTLAALQGIPEYNPSNQTYTAALLQKALDEMTTATITLVQAQAALDRARDEATAKEWGFHNLILGAKDQVIAQFGNDSNEVQALGLKKKSEYKRPQKKSPGAG